MASNGTVGIDSEPTITLQPPAESKRRVSMASDPVSEPRLGYDNLGYDLHPRRKISQVKLILNNNYYKHLGCALDKKCFFFRKLKI